MKWIDKYVTQFGYSSRKVAGFNNRIRVARKNTLENPVPSMPSGVKNTSEFGEIIKWGNGSEAARDRMRTITRGELENARVTSSIAREWRDFYRKVVVMNPGNPSAPGRAELMGRCLELLRKKR